MSTTVHQTGPGMDNVVQLRISKAVYDALVADLGDDSHVRITYDGETLEIMSPSQDHESITRAFVVLINGLNHEWDLNLRDLGTTRFTTELGQFEADNTYYRNITARVRNPKRVDLSIDPPPDLIVEVDITNSSLNKFPIFAGIGIPEIWHYDLNGFSAFALIEAKYVPITVSRTIAGLPLHEIASRISDAAYSSDTSTFSRDWHKWLQNNKHLHKFS